GPRRVGRFRAGRRRALGCARSRARRRVAALAGAEALHALRGVLRAFGCAGRGRAELARTQVARRGTERVRVCGRVRLSPPRARSPTVRRLPRARAGLGLQRLSRDLAARARLSTRGGSADLRRLDDEQAVCRAERHESRVAELEAGRGGILAARAEPELAGARRAPSPGAAVVVDREPVEV